MNIIWILINFITIGLMPISAFGETDRILSRRGEFVAPQTGSSFAELNKVLFTDTQNQNEDLKRVKIHLLNGEVDMANVYLKKMAYSKTKLRPVVLRYLGMLNFIEGKFARSLEYLSKRELAETGHYKKICTLKILNIIVLDLKGQLQEEWDRCKLLNYNEFQNMNFVWLETLVEMKLKPKIGSTAKPFKGLKLASLNNEQLKIFLKLALYLNQEKLLLDELKEMDLDQLQDPEVREIVGHIYFRNKSLVKSYKFIEDLDSPNAENIKGNLYVLRKKYEIAYAQFKLALEKKANSQNSMERLLPLAWLLGDWSEGEKIAARVIASPQTQINKLTLASAFQTQKGDYKKAKTTLNSINQISKMGKEIEVTQLYSFVGLMENDQDVVKKQSSLSCQQFDLVNCWLSFQLEQWDSFPLTIRREELIPSRSQWRSLASEVKTDPLKETIYVNQLDIEELDDKQIDLIPNGK